MDPTTKSIIISLLKQGECTDLICCEMGVTSQDIKNVLAEEAQILVSNILAEQLATRLPVLLEFSFKQLQHIILNANTDRQLKAINMVIQASTALAKLKP